MPLTDVQNQRLADQQIQGIETTISRLKLCILKLKTCRNVYCAVSKLPVEVIVEIFTEANRGPEGESLFGFSCFSISAVCRSWRAIALDTPRLWSFIDVASVPLQRCWQMVTRSKSVPLHIRYDFQTEDCSNIDRDDFVFRWQVVMSQLERIRTMEITTHNPDYLAQVLHLHSLPPFPLDSEYIRTTSLQVLQLTCQSPRLVLSKDFFPFEMPLLRVLILRGGIIGTRFPPLPSLTHLDIVFPSFVEQSMPHLLRCFQNAPNIETLSIEGRIADVSSQDSTVARISLAKLRRLKISTPLFSSLKILDYLPLPVSTTIRLTCPPEDFEYADLTSLKTFSRFAFGEAVSIDHVGLTLTTDNQVEVSLVTSRPDGHLAVWFPFSDYYFGDIITSLSEALPLADAPSLKLTGFTFEFGVRVDIAWGDVFEPFQGVNILRFFQCNDRNMLSGLVGSSDSEYLPVPALREIHFADCITKDDRPKELDLDWDTMRTILSQRKDLGVHVQFYWDDFCFTDDVEEEEF